MILVSSGKKNASVSRFIVAVVVVVVASLAVVLADLVLKADTRGGRTYLRSIGAELIEGSKALQIWFGENKFFITMTTKRCGKYMGWRGVFRT